MKKVNININKINNNSSVNLLDKKAIEELKENIKEYGLIQPITVRKIDEDNYEVIDGVKRLEACKLLGLENIEAIEDDKLSSLALTNNLSRKDANPINQAKGFEKLMAEQGLTQQELADKLGYKQSTIANKIRLLKLPEQVVEAISNGTISERHGRALLKVKEEDINEIFNNIVEKNYNVAKSEKYIKDFYSSNVNKGLCGSYQIAVNTIKQAVEMCKKANLDIDYNQTDYDDQLKIVIKIRK